MSKIEPVPGKDGNRYVPFEERTGGELGGVFHPGFVGGRAEEGL